MSVGADSILTGTAPLAPLNIVLKLIYNNPISKENRNRYRSTVAASFSFWRASHPPSATYPCLS